MATAPRTGTPTSASSTATAAEAIPDHGEPRRIDHRILPQHVEACLRAGAHERAILVVDGALLDHLLDVLGADRLAEDVRRECDIAQLRHHLCVLAGQIR